MMQDMENSPEMAREWLKKVSLKDSSKDGAFVVGLSGHLGAGKTAFVKLVAKELGIEETVTSPTYVIMKIYETGDENGVTNGSFKRLVHIDAYRLERRAELEALRFEEVVSDPHNLVMIEWPENVELSAADMDIWLKFEIREGKYVFSAETAE